MKIKVSSSGLAAALGLCQIAAVNSLDEKAPVWLGVKGNRLVCRTTDLSVFVEAIVLLEEAEGDVNALVTLAPLQKFCSGHDSQMEMNIEAGEVRLKSKSSTARIKTLDIGTFSVWPARPDFSKYASVDARQLTGAIRSVSFCASAALATPELYNIHVVKRQGNLVVEAGDSHRYSRIKIPTKKAGNIDALIPLKTAQRMPAPTDRPVQIGEITNFVCFRSKAENFIWTLWCRTSQGQYPDVEAAVDALKTKTKIRLDPKALANLLGMCLAYSDADYRPVKLIIADNGLTAQAHEKATGSFKSTMKVNKKVGADTVVLVDAQYVLDGLANGSEVEMSFNGPESPFKLSVPGNDVDFLYVMWPLKLKEEVAEKKEDKE